MRTGLLYLIRSLTNEIMLPEIHLAMVVIQEWLIVMTSKLSMSSLAESAISAGQQEGYVYGSCQLQSSGNKSAL